MKCNSIFKLFIGLTMVFVASFAQAYTLAEYIDKHCPKYCVNPNVLHDTVTKAANFTRINSKILLAIIEVESSFSTRAKNNGSLGLAQINIRYHRDKFSGKDYFNVRENIFAGAEILSDCLQLHKGSYQRALSCYNGLPPSNPKYANKVFKTVEKQSAIKTMVAEDPIRALLELQGVLDQPKKETIHETQPIPEEGTAIPAAPVEPQ